MGSFTFQWDHPATEVYVTGTFDDWAKTAKLEKKEGTRFEKTVELPYSDRKIYYKFVVDGIWTTDHTAPQEKDDANNLNNVLRPDQITKSNASTSAGAAIMSGVTPKSTTADLANKVPIEPRGHGSMPGDFPETPAQETSAFLVNPIPATAGASKSENIPDPIPVSSTTTSSAVRDEKTVDRKVDPIEPAFAAVPLPATGGIGNPIRLSPGEKVPHPSNFTNNTVLSTATLDRESYEKGGSAIGIGASVLPNLVAPLKEQRQKDTGMLSMPPITKNMIPESSLPMGGTSDFARDPGVFISSAAPQSTTAALAAQVPLESSRGAAAVPAIVQASQAQAHVGPEASASTEAVREKSQVEQEFMHKIHEQPGVAAVGAMSNGTADGVPAVVQASIGKAHQNPEAAASAEAVTEKAAMEKELLHDIRPSQSSGEPAPTMGAVGQATAAAVPVVVSESIQQAHQGPEAAANAEAVAEKKAMEAELLHDVKPEQGTGQPAPTTHPTPNATSTTPTQTSPDPSASQPTSNEPSGSPVGKKEARRSGFFGIDRSAFDSSSAPGNGHKRRSSFFRKISEKFTGRH